VKCPLDPHLLPYEDHIGLWANELQAWFPDRVFDAHVHIGPKEAVRAIACDRLGWCITTFASMTWQESRDWYAHLYRGKQVVGMIAFGFPLRETDVIMANDYVGKLAALYPWIHGFLLVDPRNIQQAIDSYHTALDAGISFRGVKPYHDFLRDSCSDTKIEELLPNDLLVFMARHELILMLHTCSFGVGDPCIQEYLREAISNDSGLLECPSLYLEISTASQPEVYEYALTVPGMRQRLLFGSDLPYALIAGEEYWSEETGKVFVTRDQYPWTDVNLNQRLSSAHRGLTYHAYHTIHGLKTAMDRLNLSTQEYTKLKNDIFLYNAQRLLNSSQKVE